MRFLRYQKIYENSGNYEGSAESEGSAGWVVQEKIHGANFSAYCAPRRAGSHDDGARRHADEAVSLTRHDYQLEVRYAKRNGFLDVDADLFYGFQRLDDVLGANVRKLWAAVREEQGEELAQLTVYGELFGGWLPDEQLAGKGWQAVMDRKTGRKDGNVSAHVLAASPVQEGVYYSNDLQFVVFDVALLFRNRGGCQDETAEADADDADRDAAGNVNLRLRFLPVDDVERLCGSCGFLAAQPLLRTDKYIEAANFDVSSLISPMGLRLNTRPRVAASTTAGTTASTAGPCLRSFLERENFAEGVVVRPAGAADFLFPNPRTAAATSSSSGTLDVPPRCLLKVKHARFVEEVENCAAGDLNDPRKGAELHAATFESRVARLCNRNRLAAVLSKDLGAVEDLRTQEDAENAAQQLAEDVWEAFWGRGWDLGALDWESADSYVRTESGKLVRGVVER